MKAICQLINMLVFLFLIPQLSFGTGAKNYSTIEYLVDFLPEIFLDSGERCHGVRIDDEHILTSMECSQGIREKLKDSTVQVLDEFDTPVGEIKNEPAGNAPLEMRVPLSNQSDNVYKQYPEIRNVESEISGSYTYLTNSNGSQVQVAANLMSKEVKGQESSYVLFGIDDLTSGKPVFDANHNLVCIASANKQCIPLT
ncbi:MAG: hypothetical protein ACR2PT_21395 [Endozoicomonas sp.]